MSQTSTAVYEYLNNASLKLQQIIRSLTTAQKSLLIAGLLALGMAPLYILTIPHLDQIQFRYTCIWFLFLLSMYLIYVSVEYKKTLQKTRHLRLENNFLRYHFDQETLFKTVQFPENLWANSYIFKLCRQVAFPQDKEQKLVLGAQPESGSLKKMSQSRALYRAFSNPDLDSSFESSFGKLCPQWFNFSFGFLLSFAWLLLKFHERVPANIFNPLSAWYVIAWASLIGCFVSELVGVYFRYQTYLHFPLLKTTLVYVAANTIIEPTFEDEAPKAPVFVPVAQKPTVLKHHPVPKTPRWDEMIDQAQQVVTNLNPQISNNLQSFHTNWTKISKNPLPITPNEPFTNEEPLTNEELLTNETLLPNNEPMTNNEPITQFEPLAVPAIKEPDTLTDYNTFSADMADEPTTEELIWTGLDAYVALTPEDTDKMLVEPQTQMADENMLPLFSALKQLVR